MGNGNSSLLLVLVLFALLLLASSRSRRRVQRQREEIQAQALPGAEVVTTSGLFATVVGVLEDGTLRLETAPGQVSRWDRMAVARVVTPPPAAEAPPGPAVEPGVEPGAEPYVAPAEPPAAPGVQDTAPPDRL